MMFGALAYSEVVILVLEIAYSVVVSYIVDGG
jgi:hypothetical protein